MYLERTEYIARQSKIRMGEKSMASFMYAMIITKSVMTCAFGISIYQHTRKQNCRGWVEIMIHIHPSQIEKFEEESGISLSKPVEAHTN